MDRPFEWLVASLPGFPEPGVPAAASRAGAVGLLNLTSMTDADRAAKAVDRFLELAHGRGGLIIDGNESWQLAIGSRQAEKKRSPSSECRVPRFEMIIIDQPCFDTKPGSKPGAKLSEMIAQLRNSAERVGCVTLSKHEAALAAEAGVDFLVAKGHEAGGYVGHETTFILLQSLLGMHQPCPVYAWGGVGMHTAAACKIAGAAGVVMDWGCALARESALPLSFQRTVAQMDGSETIIITLPDGRLFRCYEAKDASDRATKRRSDRAEPSQTPSSLQRSVAPSLSRSRHLAVGQDAAWAGTWAERGSTVAGMLRMVREHVERHIAGCVDGGCLAAGSALAQSHGTEFPIVQGPMTRVSDQPAFCDVVEQGGALPFLALALMRGEQVRELLESTRQRMGERPWGVGILGFVNKELRREQLAVVEQVRPPFAIISGGQPHQAAELEAIGIRTILHVASPLTLEHFLAEGARRFIFEGRECGGHVGPRTSFVLWESMVEVLLQADLDEEEARKVHVLFAGGIHDALSAAMVAAIAQPLVERGMKVGVLIGTAYLFTDEIVTTGATLQTYQRIAIETDQTVLLDSGPGHSVRCADTAFTRAFEQEKQRLIREGFTSEQVREALEKLNVGRLRIATKGLTRQASNGAADSAAYISVDAQAQLADGMYMMGQVASLRTERMTIRQLHEDVSSGAMEVLGRWKAETSKRQNVKTSRGNSELIPVDEPVPPRLDVAIVGMAGILPSAADLAAFWQALLAGRDCVGEVPCDRFDAARWYDPDRAARDKAYSKWGGFISDVPFDPFRYGIPPKAMTSIEPVQLLTLELVRKALEDAGADERGGEFRKSRTSVILGAGGGMGELGTTYMLRSMLPGYLESIDESLLGQLPEWTEDSFPGVLLNVIAGRVSNRFDFGGVNYTVDAACASSLAAVYLGCRELADGTSDVAIAGGVDTMNHPFGYMAFSKTGALSSRGRCRAFDASADGIAISEGLAAVVLKRREDAERDGDRIYAVIRGIAGGSDGRHRSLTAPSSDGQLRTLRRAYRQARINPATVGLFEAHGTGTSLGDVTECQSLCRLIDEQVRRSDEATERASDEGTERGRNSEIENADRIRPNSIALGSVKSMIGHTKSAAGVVGLMKVALSIYHRVLPPTLLVERPNPAVNFGNVAVYPNTQLRPWIRSEHPRRAGVSAFGFGGTNFHAVLEEYEGHLAPPPSPHRNRSAELFAFTAAGKAELGRTVDRLAKALARAEQAGVRPTLADLAFSWYCEPARDSACRAAVVATDVADLRRKLNVLLAHLSDSDDAAAKLPEGVFVMLKEHAEVSTASCRAVFLFPGQGSQAPDMLRDLAVEFPVVREAFERADAHLCGVTDCPLSALVFPPPPFTDEQRREAFDQVKATDVAQPALGAAGVAMLRLLESFGVHPSMVGGHSYGELVALHAAGCLDEASLLKLSHARGKAMAGATADAAGGMLALRADENAVRALLSELDDAEAWIANLNGPHQTVISGTETGLERVAKLCEKQRIACTRLPVACAFHSPLMEPACKNFREALSQTEFQSAAAELPVYANSRAGQYPGDSADAIEAILAEQVLQPVRFVEQIERMFVDGGRVFIEVGPQSVLTSLVKQILRDKPHVAVATQPTKQDSLLGLLHALAQLHVAGLPVTFEPLFATRDLTAFNLSNIASQIQQDHPAHVWFVNGSYARPSSQPPRVPQPKATMHPAPAHDESPHHPDSQTDKRSGESELRTQHSETNHQEDSHHDAAFTSFQETMRQFLDTQRRVMEAYFGGATSEAASQPVTSTDEQEKPRPTADKPVETSTQNSEKSERAEVTMNGSHGNHDSHGSAESAESANAEPAPIALEEQLRQSAAERTGYPPEMLELDADLEADLGIDSIKRVEIIAAFRRAAVPSVEKPPAWFVDAASDARSLQQVLDAVKRLAEESGIAPAADTTRNGVHGSTASSEQPVEAETAIAPIALEEKLRESAAERTGYPPEMLELDADLEADLGIDSIKRVEIIAAFRRAAVPSVEKPPAWFVDAASDARTLQQVLDAVGRLIEEHASHTHGRNGTTSSTLKHVSENGVNGVHTGGNGTVSENGRAPHQHNGAAHAEPAVDDCPRCVAAFVDAPIADSSCRTAAHGAIVVTCHDALAAAKELEALQGEFATDALQWVTILPEQLHDATAAAERIAQIRAEHGTIAGLIHLLPLQNAPSFPEIDSEDWRRFADVEVKSVLHLLKALAPELAASEAGQFMVMTCSAQGRDFGAADDALHPWRAGLAGMLKTAAHEWPGACFRSVDCDEQAMEQISNLVNAEFGARDPVEVGYRDGRRLTIRAERATLADSVRSVKESETLLYDATVLVTGGARGITAEVVDELAGQCPDARFVLLGRTPLSDEPEDPAIASITDPMELRRAVRNAGLRDGVTMSLSEVEREVRRLSGVREVQQTLGQLRARGASAEYHACDVRDPAALRRVIDDVTSRHGGIDVLIHGAGVIEDKLIADKTSDSYDRVLGTKIEPMLALVRLLDPAKLRAVVLFSSVAAFVGNKGQGDYAAANEILNTMARRLHDVWPGRVVAINWGPWESATGMVSPEIAQQFAERGIGLVSVPSGRRMCWQELVRAEGDDVCVIIGPGYWAAQSSHVQPQQESLQTFSNSKKRAIVSAGELHVESKE